MSPGTVVQVYTSSTKSPCLPVQWYKYTRHLQSHHVSWYSGTSIHVICEVTMSPGTVVQVYTSSTKSPCLPIQWYKYTRHLQSHHVSWYSGTSIHVTCKITMSPGTVVQVYTSSAKSPCLLLCFKLPVKSPYDSATRIRHCHI